MFVHGALTALNVCYLVGGLHHSLSAGRPVDIVLPQMIAEIVLLLG